MDITFLELSVKIVCDKLKIKDYKLIDSKLINKLRKEKKIDQLKKETFGYCIRVIRKNKSESIALFEVLLNGEPLTNPGPVVVYATQNKKLIPEDIQDIVTIFVSGKKIPYTITGKSIYDREVILPYLDEYNVKEKCSNAKNPFVRAIENIDDYVKKYNRYPTIKENKTVYTEIKNAYEWYSGGNLITEYIKDFEQIPGWIWDYYRLTNNGAIIMNIIEKIKNKTIKLSKDDVKEIKTYKKKLQQLKPEISDWFKCQVIESGVLSLI